MAVHTSLTVVGPLAGPPRQAASAHHDVVSTQITVLCLLNVVKAVLSRLGVPGTVCVWNQSVASPWACHLAPDPCKALLRKVIAILAPYCNVTYER